jgi:adenine/guanine phosphoribosyltransferase-like PRPP-binding protein
MPSDHILSEFCSTLRERNSKPQPNNRKGADEHYLTFLATGDFISVAVSISDAISRFSPTKIVALASLGIPIGALVAGIVKIGLVVIRKGDAKDEGDHFVSIPYYDNTTSEKAGDLCLLIDTITLEDRVVVIDDQIDSGGQICAACSLLSGQGATIAAVVANSVMQEGSHATRDYVAPENRFRKTGREVETPLLNSITQRAEFYVIFDPNAEGDL